MLLVDINRKQYNKNTQTTSPDKTRSIKLINMFNDWVKLILTYIIKMKGIAKNNSWKILLRNTVDNLFLLIKINERLNTVKKAEIEDAKAIPTWL